jgi:[protein-PII] uridylyltransferase
VADLVRLHLLLVETALREDLDDEDVLLRCAGRVGRRDLLAPLHLITAADSRATGPATWSAWTAALVGTLVSRLDSALSPDVDGVGLAERGESVRAACLASLEDGGDARAFVERAPLRYLASRSETEVARDAGLVARLAQAPAATTALLAVSPGPAEETYAVTIASVDRPQLLARLSGAMALAGLDILSVNAHGVTGGIALDSFVVTSATARPVTTETFTALERMVDASLRDRLELAVRLRERARHYPPRAARAAAVSIEPAGWMTALHVSAPDRPGLLHDIARAVAASGLQIGWAKVQTIEGMARDVFSLVGPDGAPADDPGLLGHVTMNVREVL